MADTDNLKQARREAALRYHEGNSIPAGSGTSRPGKLEIVASKSIVTQRDLSLAYSPGVAEPCKVIAKDPEAAYTYTVKGNLVGIITNGTAVLGLGNIGALAGKPVMEGKAVLFKKFADIDCFDIEVGTTDIESFIETVANLEPTFGAINLEDIRAPDCFEIERRLRERLKIPVMHDDQHGTAIISGAALLNALDIVDKRIEDVKVVHCGGGAASIACARFWKSLGVKKENCIMTDVHGVVYVGREKDMNEHKSEFAIDGNAWHSKPPRTLSEAMVGADVFMGCSVANILTGDMLKTLADKPIVFAMANPDPEINYEEALEARADMIFATGRSDHPNQVNNVLGYPFIFRGALDVRASAINEEMKIAAAKALALLAREDVPESVVAAYGGKPLRFGREYIIPKPFDPRVLLWVSPAVAKAAIASNVARFEMPGGSEDSYRRRLEKLLGKTRSVMRDLRDRIVQSPVIEATEPNRVIKPGSVKTGTAGTNTPSNNGLMRIIFPEGENEKILRACEIIKEERIAEPVLLGDYSIISEKIKELNLVAVKNCEVIRPRKHEHFEEYARELWDMRKRKGFTPALSRQLMKDPLYFGAMHLRRGAVDAWISGATRPYPDTIRPTLHVIGARAGQKVAGVYMLIWKDRVVFLSDTTVNIDPTSEELADIAINTANAAQFLGFEPRVGMLSFSNFGSNIHPEATKVRVATEIVQRRRPDLVVDGEIQADTAVNPALIEERYPFCRLRDGGANVLICPNLSAANICYKLLGQLGGAEVVGPILIGMNKPVHVLQLNAEVMEIVNVAVIAVLDAQREKVGLHP